VEKTKIMAKGRKDKCTYDKGLSLEGGQGKRGEPEYYNTREARQKQFVTISDNHLRTAKPKEEASFSSVLAPVGYTSRKTNRKVIGP